MSDSLEQRVKRMEDRYEISECVIKYAMSLDRRDWDLFQSCIADPIFIDFSDWSGMEAREWGRFLMRGSYTNAMQRRPEGGWEISGMTQHFSWGEGNEDVFVTSKERFEERTTA